MLIKVTKGLAKFTEMSKLSAPSNDVNPFFSWCAKLFMIKNSHYLVFANELTKFTLFMKNPDWNLHVGELFIANLAYAVQTENIETKLGARYVLEGESITFAKAPELAEDPLLDIAIENCCRIMEVIKSKSFALGMEATKLYKMSGISFQQSDLPKDSFASCLKKRFSKPPKTHKAFDLNVRLDLDGNDAIRKVRVPADITFHQLHLILQKSFGWHDYHLHSFGLFKRWKKNYCGKPDVVLSAEPDDIDIEFSKIFGKNNTLEAMFEDEDNSDAIPEKSVKLSDYIPQYKKIIYDYDFGDSWRHYIEVEQILDSCTDKLPALLSGHGDAPPEDVGGVPGFAQFKEIMKDPTHEEYESYSEWANGQMWEPFDYKSTAKEVKRSLK
jgi:hypothetical protein